MWPNQIWRFAVPMEMTLLRTKKLIMLVESVLLSLECPTYYDAFYRPSYQIQPRNVNRMIFNCGFRLPVLFLVTYLILSLLLRFQWFTILIVDNYAAAVKTVENNYAVIIRNNNNNTLFTLKQQIMRRISFFKVHSYPT